jgi:hypothetical protein
MGKKLKKILPKIILTTPLLGIVGLVSTSCNDKKPDDSLNIYLDDKSAEHVFIDKKTATKNKALIIQVTPDEGYEILSTGFQIKIGEKILESNKDYVITFYSDLPYITLKIFPEAVINDIYIKILTINVGPYKDSDKMYT